jgi:hypothetical protein
MAFLLMTTGPLLAANGLHKPCIAVQQPDCHQTTRLGECCCCDGSDGANQAGFAQARIDAVADHHAAIVPVVPDALLMPLRFGASSHLDTSPRYGPSAKLPILIADLRL